jgi:methionyl aminopeptidase
MSITSQAELKALRAVGRVVRLALQAMRRRVAPGVSTRELDDAAARVLEEGGARSAPRLVYDFPGCACISVNDEIVHGVPGQRIVRPGDVVKLDVVAEKDGFIADAAITVPVPPVSDQARRLIDCVESAFQRAMSVARVGRRVNDIGRAVELEVRDRGFSVVRQLTGHGVGRSIHEKPTIPNFYDPRRRRPLTEGLVVAVEPIVCAGTGRAVTSADGWTVRTADCSPSAHFEHTLVITDGEPILLTAA